MVSSAARPVKGAAYEIFMLLMSLLSMANMLAIAVAQFSAEPLGPSTQVLLVMELALAPVFLFDFLYRLRTTRPRRTYFFRQMGWADLVAVIPVLRAFRIVRVASVTRALQIRGREEIAEELAESRAIATFLVTIFLVFLVVEVAGATIYSVEVGDPQSNIASPSDAIWWGLVTITTVGYGDYYPVTQLGRIIGVFLLFAGIALFSVLTGFIANVFLAPRRRRLLARSADDTARSLAALRGLLAEQDERSLEIGRRLDELERSIRSQRGARGRDDPEQEGGTPRP